MSQDQRQLDDLHRQSAIMKSVKEQTRLNIIKLGKSGLPVAAIARRLSVDWQKVKNTLNEAGITVPRAEGLYRN